MKLFSNLNVFQDDSPDSGTNLLKIIIIRDLRTLKFQTPYDRGIPVRKLRTNLSP